MPPQRATAITGRHYRWFGDSQRDITKPAVAIRPAMPSGTEMPAKNCPHSHDVGDPRVAYTVVQDVQIRAFPTMATIAMTAEIAYRSRGADQPLPGDSFDARDPICSPMSSRSVMLMS